MIHAYDYFKRSGDAVISNSVLVKEKWPISFRAIGTKAMKDKAKMSLNWVNIEVDENAFENDTKENRKKNKKKIRKSPEKMIKTKTGG